MKICTYDNPATGHRECRARRGCEMREANYVCPGCNGSGGVNEDRHDDIEGSVKLITTLRARVERAEADVKSLRHSMRMADCHSEDDWRRLAMHLEWEWGQCSSRLNRAAGDRDAAQAAISELTVQVGRLREALTSIARNTCCEKCQEAALVARAALGEWHG